MKYKKKKEREKKVRERRISCQRIQNYYTPGLDQDSEGEECWRKKTNFRVTRRKEIFQFFTTAVKRLIGRAT